MAEVLDIAPGVFVPAHGIQVRVARSGGPGGQNVNKVSSKVDLRVDIARIEGIDAATRHRIRSLAEAHLDADGWLVVVSQRSRDQRFNLEDARAKARSLVLRALAVPKSRRKTRPSRGSIERRIAQKKHRSDLKSARRPARD